MEYVLVSKKNALVISVGPEGRLVITDENRKQGGSIASRRGRKVSWKNDTSRGVCYLEFRRLLNDDGDQYGGSIWPFKEPVPEDKRLRVPAGDPVVRTLTDEHLPLYVEYDVKCGTGTADALALDPVIIIEQ